MFQMPARLNASKLAFALAYSYLCEMIAPNDIFGIADDAAFARAAPGDIPPSGRRMHPLPGVSARSRASAPKRCARRRRFRTYPSNCSRRTTSTAARRPKKSSPRRRPRGHDSFAPPDAVAGALRTGVPRLVHTFTAPPRIGASAPAALTCLRRKGSSLVSPTQADRRLRLGRLLPRRL